MAERENLEWTDTWWEQANDREFPRFLLLGDSVARDYHPFVQQRLAGRALVDRFTTSKFCGDPFFQRELALYLEEYPYDAIHINHGLHGRQYGRKDFAACYEQLVHTVMTACPAVILATSTPVAVMEPEPVRHPERTAENRERNLVIGEVARRHGLTLNDLNSAAEDRFALKCGDGVHFLPAGSDFLAGLVEAALLPYLDGKHRHRKG